MQLANYCRDRIHHALTEELNKIEVADPREKPYFDLKKEWERAFTNCFQKVEEESKLIGPDTSGATALVAIVTSSHIIVANCGHSRAVLSHGKQAIPLSIDHNVRFYHFMHDNIYCGADLRTNC
jgi:protein phosphatase 2C